MDRRLNAGLIGLVLSGCALPRAEMPPEAKALPGAQPTLALMDAPPPVDPSTRRTSQRPATPAPAPPVAEAALSSPPPMPEVRPTSPAPEPAPALTLPPPSDPPTLPPPMAGEGPPLGKTPAVAAAPARDAMVLPASTPPSEPVREIRDPGSSSGEAAMVGNDVITLQQLEDALKERKTKIPPDQWNDPQVRFLVTSNVLDGLVTRSLLCQAARKRLKDMKSFNEHMDKQWVESELPPLLREYKVPNVHQLKARMAEQGRSLDQVREDYRLTSLAQSYLFMKVKPKVVVSLPDKFKYYNEHLSQFDRPAQVVWREIEVDINKCPSRDEARRKAETILARLQKGEDWAKIAKAESHGATARDGGRWETAPDSHALADINAALRGLPPGRFTNVIEVPGAFHIVGVESRRPAGPARFDEVQADIEKTLLEQKSQALCQTEVEALRSKTVITTMFDRPQSDPSPIRTGAHGR